VPLRLGKVQWPNMTALMGIYSDKKANVSVLNRVIMFFATRKDITLKATSLSNKKENDTTMLQLDIGGWGFYTS